MEIILASASPRRRELLSSLNIGFKAVSPNTDESTCEPGPAKRAAELSLKKGKSVAADYPQALIISADTVVYMKGEFFNKPKDALDAERILTALQGKKHKVYTGVTLIKEGKVKSFSVCSAVKMKSLTLPEIREYIEKYRPLDKAGAYGIQDRVVIEGYSGSYSNIVGLPLERLERELKKWSCL